MDIHLFYLWEPVEIYELQRKNSSDPLVFH